MFLEHEAEFLGFAQLPDRHREALLQPRVADLIQQFLYFVCHRVFATLVDSVTY